MKITIIVFALFQLIAVVLSIKRDPIIMWEQEVQRQKTILARQEKNGNTKKIEESKKIIAEMEKKIANRKKNEKHHRRF